MRRPAPSLPWTSFTCRIGFIGTGPRVGVFADKELLKEHRHQLESRVRRDAYHGYAGSFQRISD